MASDRPPIHKRAFATLRRSWRSIALGTVKWFTLLLVAIVAAYHLLADYSGPVARSTGLFVAVLFCASVAYLFFVASRVHVRLPGLDRAAAEELEDDTTAPAEDQEQVVTVQVVRLDAKAARVTIANDSPLPVLHAETSLALEREDEVALAAKTGTRLRGMSLTLPARSEVPAALAHSFDHVGIYRLQSMGVRVYDLLGVFSRTSVAPGQWRVRVVPNIFRLTYGIPRERKIKQSDLGVPDNPADALDYDRVRDWRPGDPLKTIHWKLVAHSQGELYTKLFETSTTTDLVLLLDPYGYDDVLTSADMACHLYDTMLEGGLSLLEHARENDIVGQVRFLGRNGNLTSASWADPGMRGLLVELAARPRPGIDALNASLRALRSLRAQSPGYAIVTTSRLSEKGVEELIACRAADIPLLVVHALSDESTQEAAEQRSFDERLRSASIPIVALTDGPQIVREVTTS